MSPRDAKKVADKFTSELAAIAHAYGKVLPSPKEHYEHDLALMLAWNDLKNVTLKCFQQRKFRRSVKAEYAFTVANGQGRPEVARDSTNGISLVPVPSPFALDVTAERNGNAQFYEDELWLDWSSRRYRRPQGEVLQFGQEAGGTTREVFVAEGDTRRAGTVKRFLEEKGYGFITPDGAEMDVFVHVSELPRALVQGERVSFIPTYTPRGTQARSVRVVQ